MLIGDEDGSVQWCRNTGTASKPTFATARYLIPASPVGWSNDHGKGEWGLRAKICATDWNGDGKLDLLLGDLCGGFTGKPTQQDDERQREREALMQLPELQRDWSESFRFYRSLSTEKAAAASSLRAHIKDLKKRIAEGQAVISKYKPQRQSHGYVWVFLRR